jgi:hypothetical protein
MKQPTVCWILIKVEIRHHGVVLLLSDSGHSMNIAIAMAFLLPERRNVQR